MNHRRIFCSVLFLAAATAGFATLDPAEEITQTDVAFSEATREKGLDGWVSYFADDAVLTQRRPIVQGKEGVRSAYQKMFSNPTLDFTWEPMAAEVFPAGELGYTTGRYSLKYTNDKGEKISETGRYLTIWKRQDDSTWKVIGDYGSPDPPRHAGML